MKLYTTQALSPTGKTFPLIAAHLGNYYEDANFQGYPAQFPPIQEKLPVAANREGDIKIFFYFFPNWDKALPFRDIHVYAKSAVYAYCHLIEHTNILECGRVEFHCEEHVGQIVYPYLKASGLESLYVGEHQHRDILHRFFAGYIPILTEQTDRFRYVFKTDCDVWAIGDKPIDFTHLCDTWDDGDADLFGCYVDRAKDEDLMPIYCEPINPSDFKGLMQELFNQDTHVGLDITPVAGDFIGVRTNSFGSVELRTFYDKYSNILLHDEGLYGIFLKHIRPTFRDVRIDGLFSRYADESLEMTDTHFRNVNRTEKVEL